MFRYIMTEYIRFSLLFGAVNTFLMVRWKSRPVCHKDGKVSKPWVIRWFILVVISWPLMTVLTIYDSFYSWWKRRNGK